MYVASETALSDLYGYGCGFLVCVSGGEGGGVKTSVNSLCVVLFMLAAAARDVHHSSL